MTITCREKILELKKGLNRLTAEADTHLEQLDEALFHENFTNEMKSLVALAQNVEAELHFLKPVISIEQKIKEQIDSI